MSWRRNPLYQTRAWRNLSALLRQKNPICQRLEDGVQCNRKSEVVHHLQSPDKNPSAALAWPNLVAVCTAHHPAGRPGASVVEEYVATYGVENAVYFHGHGHASWKCGTTLDIESSRPHASIHTGNIEAQNKALAGADLDALLAVTIPGAPTT
jgi:hypothetical protein